MLRRDLAYHSRVPIPVSAIRIEQLGVGRAKFISLHVHSRTGRRFECPVQSLTETHCTAVLEFRNTFCRQVRKKQRALARQHQAHLKLLNLIFHMKLMSSDFLTTFTHQCMRQKPRLFRTKNN
ncbi:hypothetical protein BKA67DRAFT_273406 [Truncatella angustata]|uniref:Uncharacterized protein n=1 Tax=Truncatella angustata TaxID=152316 RepID=A0A9P8ZXL8_9PEZI|nr:uncharacterized protein BKA67DRAFT_273406 [Truncatella angustata]KAH6654258.1 hypothetical protein BKA67DRAFT_273406 [Truncatella angustata]